MGWGRQAWASVAWEARLGRLHESKSAQEVGPKPYQLILILHTSPFTSHPQIRREERPLAPMGHHKWQSHPGVDTFGSEESRKWAERVIKGEPLLTPLITFLHQKQGSPRSSPLTPPCLLPSSHTFFREMNHRATQHWGWHGHSENKDSWALLIPLTAPPPRWQGQSVAPHLAPRIGHHHG